jgi:hypothetical protein
MLQKNCARKIRDFIFSLPEGELFTTRDLMKYGSRCSVDQNLSRLAQLGVIVRITRGVFMRDTADSKRPSVRAVAYAKAHAFCKDIIDVPAAYPIEPQSENEKIFLCASSGGSFKYGDITIVFKRISARKFYDLKDAELAEKYPNVFDCSPYPQTKHTRLHYFPENQKKFPEEEAAASSNRDSTIEYEFIVAEDQLLYASSF